MQTAGYCTWVTRRKQLPDVVYQFSGVEPTDLIACYHNLQFRIVMF